MYRLELTLEELVELARVLADCRDLNYVPQCIHHVIEKCDDEMDRAGIQLKRRIS